MAAPASSPALERAAPGTSRPPRRLLVDRTFGPYFWANLASNIGQWFHTVTAAAVAFQLTQSSRWVAAVAAAQFAPTLLLAPWAGALGDRVDRRRALYWAQLVCTVSSAAITLQVLLVGIDGLPSPWPVLVATAGIGLGYAVAIPVQQSLVPALVPPEDLDEAIALNSVTYNLARAVGPALAGLALATVGAGFAFLVNAVSYLPLLVVLFGLRPRSEQLGGGDRSITAGLRHVLADRPALLLLGGILALGVTSDPVNTLSPGMADLLGRGEGFVGILVAAFGLGAAVMTGVVGRLRRRFGQPRLAAAGLAVLSAGIGGFAVAPSPLAAVVALAVAGAGFLLAITALTTLLQRRTPDALRGRVMALWGVAFLGSRPLAAALDGAVADFVNVRAGVAVAAVLGLLGAVVLARSARRGLLDQ